MESIHMLLCSLKVYTNTMLLVRMDVDVGFLTSFRGLLSVLFVGLKSKKIIWCGWVGRNERKEKVSG